jgi:hypothetical protein
MKKAINSALRLPAEMASSNGSIDFSHTISLLNQRVWAIVSTVIQSIRVWVCSLKDAYTTRSVWTRGRCQIEASVGVAPRSPYAFLL